MCPFLAVTIIIPCKSRKRWAMTLKRVRQSAKLHIRLPTFMHGNSRKAGQNLHPHQPSFFPAVMNMLNCHLRCTCSMVNQCVFTLLLALPVSFKMTTED
ncbi:hypothetical protein CW304_21300 [Bacillus sp. UFRGS-B20]|nr:hypothetical protein CW304_21300 [Bacillus sp. UFRGS-B20]